MSTSHRRHADTRTLATRASGALAIALTVNLAIGWIALSQDLVGSTAFFRYPAIVVWTALGMSGAAVVHGALTRRSAAGDRTFVRIAAVVLVLSFVPDIGLALGANGVTASEAIGLMSLHIPPAVVAVVTLPETPLAR
jgi:hypothetical protein